MNLPFEHSVPPGRTASSIATADRVCDLDAGAPFSSRRFEAIAESAAMRRVFAVAARAAHSSVTVMITGETGTGKELVARATHELGPRCSSPFVSVNCAAVPESLLDAELFGHVRGAFTGADRNRIGLFEEAEDGTLFLDEITEAPASIQAKLLRVLQERELRPVGASRSRPVRCRVVATSNLDLHQEVAGGRLRHDLFYRLNVFPIAVPPLRERREDIAPLARHFLALHAKRDGRPDLELTAAALRALEERPWPGNARELENALARAVALAPPDAAIDVEELRAPQPSLSPERESPRVCAEVRTDLRSQVECFEAEVIREVIARNQGHKSRSARELGLTREGLFKKMKRLGIA